MRTQTHELAHQRRQQSPTSRGGAQDPWVAFIAGEHARAVGVERLARRRREKAPAYLEGELDAPQVFGQVFTALTLSPADGGVVPLRVEYSARDRKPATETSNCAQRRWTHSRRFGVIAPSPVVT
jgi:hypothetical protein